MRPFVKVAGLVLCTLGIAGCASTNVGSHVELATDFRLYRTYDWGFPDVRVGADPWLDDNRFFDELVRGAVEKQLDRFGLERKRSAPDLLLYYHASLTQEIDELELDRQYAHRAARHDRRHVYDKGTLFIDFVELRTRRLLWRGWAEGGLDANDDPAMMQARIEVAVAGILRRLPTRLRSRSDALSPL
jgi:hypothetical protein